MRWTDPETITLAIVTFLASTARSLVRPDKRGVLGFLSAMIVGIAGGMICGIIMQEFKASFGFTLFCSCFSALLFHRLIYFVLQLTSEGLVRNNHYGDVFRDKINFDQVDGDANIVGGDQEHDRRTIETEEWPGGRE